MTRAMKITAPASDENDCPMIRSPHAIGDRR